MTVQELQDALSEFPPHTEVRLAMQPSWPFEYSIADVIPVCDEESPEGDAEVVYLIEGSQLGYLPAHATEVIGW